MKCIFCKICKPTEAAVEVYQDAWVRAQMNDMIIWERESDPERICHAQNISEKDSTQSFEEYLAMSEIGSIWSMTHVGNAFESGEGTPVDLVRAKYWYTRAYEGGSDYGLLLLGHFHLKLREYERAEEVFSTGVKRGLVPAMHCLAWTYSKSSRWRQKREEALTLLKQAAAAGDISAERFLARSMVLGRFGLSQIPNGVRLMSIVITKISALVNTERPVASKGCESVRPRIFNYLRRVCQFRVSH